MHLVHAWLRYLDALSADDIIRDLTELPGRDPYANGPSVTPPIQAAEWSLREGSGALRFAWNLDPARVGPDAVRHVLARWARVPASVQELLLKLSGVHMQVGRDGRRAKLYVYARGAPDETLRGIEAALGVSPACFGRVIHGREPNFIALDLSSDTTILSPVFHVKRYTALPIVEARLWLRELGASEGEEWASALPDGLGSDPAPFVVSVRANREGVRDVTLHVKVDRAPAALAELLPPELAARAADHFRAAARLGLLLRPTYVSRMQAPAAPLVSTVYYRLESGS